MNVKHIVDPNIYRELEEHTHRANKEAKETKRAKEKKGRNATISPIDKLLLTLVSR